MRELMNNVEKQKTILNGLLLPHHVILIRLLLMQKFSPGNDGFGSP